MRQFIILSFLLFFVVGCVEKAEIELKEYPYVIANAPESSSDVINLQAELLSLGVDEIIDYGFVWSDQNRPTLFDIKKVFEDNANVGVYSHQITSGLTVGKTYYVRAYVKSSQYVVYSNERSFKGIGGLTLKITGFSPTYGTEGRIVEIFGENFAPFVSGNIVRFGDLKVYVKSASDIKLVVILPAIQETKSVNISVETGGNTAVSTSLFELRMWTKPTMIQTKKEEF